MKPNEYLNKILDQQTFADDEQEMKDLRQRRADIAVTLRNHFSDASPSILWAGSMAKGTMIRESYDGDLTCYFKHDEDAAGSTLAEIYESVANALSTEYKVERKASAIRVRESENLNADLRIDVVPGRFIEGHAGDVNLHRTTGEKQSLKTNLQTHVDHIKDSGFADAVRLVKLWKVRNGLETAKTFALELLVVKILKGKGSLDLAEQLAHVWTEFRDHSDGLAVEDPANPNGNDLKPMLDECRQMLSTVASNTLWQIENSSWEAVFGAIEDDDGGSEGHSGQAAKAGRKAALKAAAARVATPTKPWLQGE